MRILLPVGLSQARAPYCLLAAEAILGPKRWLGSGVGLAPQLYSPPPCCCLSVSAVVSATWEKCLRNGVRFGLEIRSTSRVLCRLIMAAWQWVVSKLLWSFSAGKSVETAPRGWIYTKAFIIAVLYTIHAGEIKVWLQTVLAELKKT